MGVAGGGPVVGRTSWSAGVSGGHRGACSPFVFWQLVGLFPIQSQSQLSRAVLWAVKPTLVSFINPPLCLYPPRLLTTPREDPSRELTFTTVRRKVVGDCNLLRRIFQVGLSRRGVAWRAGERGMRVVVGVWEVYPLAREAALCTASSLQPATCPASSPPSGPKGEGSADVCCAPHRCVLSSSHPVPGQLAPCQLLRTAARPRRWHRPPPGPPAGGAGRGAPLGRRCRAGTAPPSIGGGRRGSGGGRWRRQRAGGGAAGGDGGGTAQ